MTEVSRPPAHGLLFSSANGRAESGPEEKTPAIAAWPPTFQTFGTPLFDKTV
jgi:hypothetical protein